MSFAPAVPERKEESAHWYCILPAADEAELVLVFRFSLFSTIAEGMLACY
jgi:hypothetical protein